LAQFPISYRFPVPVTKEVAGSRPSLPPRRALDDQTLDIQIIGNKILTTRFVGIDRDSPSTKPRYALGKCREWPCLMDQV
jgi:hypothetical protein